MNRIIYTYLLTCLSLSSGISYADSANSYAETSFWDDYDSENVTHNSNSEASASHALPGSDASAIAKTFVSKGVTKNFAHVISEGGYRTYASAESWAFYNDAVTFNAEGLSGQRGYVDLTIDATWELVNPQNQYGWAKSAYQFGLSSQNIFGVRTDFSYSEVIECDWTGCINDFVNSGDNLRIDGSNYTFRFHFTFGHSTDFTFSSLATAQGIYSGVDIKSDAFNSAYWAGFSDVYDSNGNLITAYTFSSNSGTDYFKNFAPIPEPTLYSMLSLGLCLTIFLRRRKV